MRLHDYNAYVLIAPMYRLVIDRLNSLGINTVFTKPIKSLICYEQYHADIQMLIIDSIAFIPQNASYLKEYAERLSLVPILCEFIDGKYPANVALNAVLLGDKIICREDALSVEVKKYCYEKNIEILNVKQGYAKCSTLVLNDNAIITADVNIHKAAVRSFVDSLLIRPGYINLDGADYGFIGGSSMVIGDTVVFFGDVNTHPDCSLILDFLYKHNMNHVSLFDGELVDIGGAVLLSKKLIQK